MHAHHGFDSVKLCDVPSGGLGDRRFAVAGQFDEAPAQLAPAMHERPRPLRSSTFGQPVITVIGIALQEACIQALQELLGEGAAATGAYGNSTIGGLGPLWPRSAETIPQK